jgi:hypothetical protein
MNRFELLQERNLILQEIAMLGEMRSGTLSMRYQKCSTKNCHCKAKGDPGHGPIYAVSFYDQDGKLRSKNIKPGKRLDSIRSQIENYHKFKELSKRFVRLNTQLCTLQDTDLQDSLTVKKNSLRKSGSLRKKK